MAVEAAQEEPPRAFLVAREGALETSDFYDLRRLFYFRKTVEMLDPKGAAKVLLLDSTMSPEFKRFGVLSGSFNPPTMAHIDLAARATKSFQLDHILFLISRITIDKPENEGLAIEDRLLLLSLLALEVGWASVAVANRGLYFQQATALRSVLGKTGKIFFVVGMDKVAQILDPRYYENREEALVKLFIEARLIAASRGGSGENELRELLNRQENENYADRVYFLPMPDQMKGLASSVVRAGIERGDIPVDELPDVVRRFISETQAYRAGYEMRRRVLDRLYELREWAEEGADLRKLLALVNETAGKGQTLRRLLEDPSSSGVELKEFLLALQS